MDDINGLLCRMCEKILGDLSPYLIYHRKYCDLVVCKNLGCFVCGWIWSRHPRRRIEEARTEETGEQGTGEGFSITASYDRGCYEKRVTFHVECASDVTYKISVILFPLNKYELITGGTVSRSFVPGISSRDWSRLDPYIGSAQSFETIQNWLSDCERGHECCKASEIGSHFPNRAIDVQEVPSNKVFLRDKDEAISLHKDETVPLQNFEGEMPCRQRCPKYWTLSHRWGDPSRITQLRTTTENQLRGGISLESLSPTFRDAAVLVWSLGYRYLWIDSMCIFQDSESDWQQEASTMTDVYSHSFCNISAISPSVDLSHDCGLFHNRKDNARALYPFLTDVGIRIILLSGPNHGPWIAWNDSMWIDEIENAPLSMRGWVAQERFLSNRTVHFTRNQLYWECLRDDRCEANFTLCLPRQLKFFNLTSRQAEMDKTVDCGYKTAKLAIVRNKVKEEATCDKASTILFWLNILSTYLSLNLTHDSDRLVAMSGIAKAFREVNHDTYLAGLWKQSIHYGFLWKTKAASGTWVQRNESSYGPSWSWASVISADTGTGVELYIPEWKHQMAPLVKVIKERIVTEPPDGDTTGLLRSAELDVECGFSYFRWMKDSNFVDIYEDEAKSQLKDERSLYCAVISFDMSARIYASKDAHIIEGACAPICRIFQKLKETTYWLVLNEAGDKFERIGIFETCINVHEPTKPTMEGSTCITII